MKPYIDMLNHQPSAISLDLSGMSNCNQPVPKQAKNLTVNSDIRLRAEIVSYSIQI